MDGESAEPSHQQGVSAEQRTEDETEICPTCGGPMCEHEYCINNWCQQDDCCPDCYRREQAETEAEDNGKYYQGDFE